MRRRKKTEMSNENRMKVTPNMLFLATSSGKTDSEPKRSIISQQIALSISLKSQPISVQALSHQQMLVLLNDQFSMAGHAP